MTRFSLTKSILLLALLAGARADAKPARWHNYFNPRFDFVACYPEGLRPGRAPDNGDGRIFTDKSGVELAVWGSYAHMIMANGQDDLSDGVPDNTTLAQGADFDAASLSRVTYKAVHDRWYVVSGKSNGQVVYMKTLAADDRWISLRLSYPATAAAKWNPLAKRIGTCLKALPSSI